MLSSTRYDRFVRDIQESMGYPLTDRDLMNLYKLHAIRTDVQEYRKACLWADRKYRRKQALPRFLRRKPKDLTPGDRDVMIISKWLELTTE